ncbi:MAG: DNA-directed RNA polymerase subunit beta, partial [Clostridia bacterium]|nr:DNA-directed RNA polymerase subunit beta [Clostridia bacterium]
MSFAKIEEPIKMPNLIEVQKKSYEWFLREGLPEVLRDVSPIVDYSGNLSIDFIGYSLESKPQYPVEECKERDVNYAAPLKVTVRLSNKATGEVKESEIFMGDFPLMTDAGTFVINGAERVIVSQLVRSPGVYFGEEMEPRTGKAMLTSTIIPYRGAWLEYETDVSDAFYVKIDKNRKLPITTLIRAFGVEKDEEIIAMFGDDPKITATFEKDDARRFAIENGTSFREEALKEIYKKLRPGEPPLVDSAEMLLNNTFFDNKRYDLAAVGRYKYDRKLGVARRIEGHRTARPVISQITGEVLCEAGVTLDRALSRELEKKGANEVYVYAEDGTEQRVFSNGAVYPETVLGYPLEGITGLTEKVRFDVLSQIVEDAKGDKKEVLRLCDARIHDLCPKHILVEDIFSSINYLICLCHGIGQTDDIDHLGNRRMRSVGELLQNQLRIGLSRLDKIVKERMTVQDTNDVTPAALINIRPVVTAIREFFGSSPLSQFMDQNNPLAELTHKRRLSALGPGGLSRDRASFDVRDVHYTHYGRMCPIETPEGPNIGLISYLATYARISEYGFIEAPFRVVDKKTGVVTDEVRYMTADVEDDYIVAQAN